MNVAQWFVGSGGVCGAGDLGRRLARVHPVDVSPSKVLHHYLLQGQSLLGYGACDVARRSRSGHFLGGDALRYQNHHRLPHNTEPLQRLLHKTLNI